MRMNAKPDENNFPQATEMLGWHWVPEQFNFTFNLNPQPTPEPQQQPIDLGNMIVGAVVSAVIGLAVTESFKYAKRARWN